MELPPVPWDANPLLPVVRWLYGAVRCAGTELPANPDWTVRNTFATEMYRRYPYLREGQVHAIMGWAWPDPQPSQTTHVLGVGQITATVIGYNAKFGSLKPNTLGDTAVLELAVNQGSKFIRLTFVGGALPLPTTGLRFKWGVWEFTLPKGAGNYYQTNVNQSGPDVVEMYGEMVQHVGSEIGIDLIPI